MLQYGDEALVSSMKRMTYMLYFILALIILRLLFVCGPGFAPFTVGGPAPNASILLPAFSVQVPLLVAVIAGIMLDATFMKNLIFVIWLIMVLSSILVVVWSALPVLLTLLACTIAQTCSGFSFFIGSVDLIIVVAMSIAAIRATYHLTEYMRGYWQREAYANQEEAYYEITDPNNYASDPLRDTTFGGNDDEDDDDDDDDGDTPDKDDEGDATTSLAPTDTPYDEGDDDGAGAFPSNSAVPQYHQPVSILPIGSTANLRVNRRGFGTQ